ncbi:hypothetical protein HK105_207566 [Polyrhizophydium stewartii]|uniref:Uncharacterized protein n=1 Tax=Polyrhizophydium stewartii TaxID=2732419 RepID=A0ABR4N067_9FUNG
MAPAPPIAPVPPIPQDASPADVAQRVADAAAAAAAAADALAAQTVDTAVRTFAHYLALFRVRGPTRLVLSNCPSVSDGTLVALLAQSRDLVSLRIDQCPRLSCAALAPLASHCPILKSLTLTKWAGMFHLDLGLPLLETFTVHRSATTEKDHLALRCPNLVHLNIDGVAMRDWMLHQILAQSGACLESLDISCRSRLLRFSPNCFRVVPEHCPKLKVFGLRFAAISDSALAMLVRGCSSTLRSLSLVQVEGIMDGAIEALAGCSRLDTLCLIDCGMLSVYSEQALLLLLKNCVALKRLVLSGNSSMSDAVLDAIASGPLINTLQELCLYMFDRLTDDGLDRFSSALARSASLRNVEFKWSLGSRHQRFPHFSSNYFPLLSF